MLFLFSYNPQISPASRLHQPQIIAVASPPPKQPHLVQQQSTGTNFLTLFDTNFNICSTNILFQICVIGASNMRAIPPPLSPQGQARIHNLQQPGLPAPGFESNLVRIHNINI